MSFRRWAQKAIIKLIEEIPFTHYAFAFLAVIFVSAIIYYSFTPVSHGIGIDGVPKINLTFWDALYFSVVTISSLGYGDMHPMGISKFMAGIQVLSGLFFMGIMLAKLTSARLAHHVSRLYGSELQRRLERFCTTFENLEEYLMATIIKLNDVFKEVPGKTTGMEKTEAVADFSRTLSKLHTGCSDLYEYVLLESERGAFFDNVPIPLLKRIGLSLDKNLVSLGQLIIGLPAEGRVNVLVNENRRRSSEITEKIKGICCCVITGLKEKNIIEIFEQVNNTCVKLPDSYYAIPQIVVEKEQPDQHLEEEDQPATHGNMSQGEQR